MCAKQPFEGQERAVRLGRSGERAQRQVEIGEEPERERRPGLDQQHRARRDLAPGVGEHEEHDDRDDRDRQAVVRDAQPAEQRPEEEVPVAPFLAPHQRPVEQQRDEEQVQTVHLGEGRLLPERPGEGQGERGREGDDRADAEADRDQDHDRRPPPAAATADSRFARYATDLDRDEAEQLPDQRVERVAGRVEDPEPGGDHLGLGPVAEADAGQQGPDVHDERHGERARPRRCPRRSPARGRARSRAGGRPSASRRPSVSGDSFV